MFDAGEGTPVRLASLFAAMGPRVAVAVPATNVEAIAAAAEARGRAEGRAEAEAELAPLRALLVAAVSRAEAAATVDAEALAPLFVELVGQVGRAVVDGELRVSGDALERLVACALTAVEVEGSVTVFVSEADHRALADHSSEDAEAPSPSSRHSGERQNPSSTKAPTLPHVTPMDSGVRQNDGARAGARPHGNDGAEVGDRPIFAIDPTLVPGDIRIETPRHVVAASLTARLAEIVAAL